MIEWSNVGLRSISPERAAHLNHIQRVRWPRSASIIGCVEVLDFFCVEFAPAVRTDLAVDELAGRWRLEIFAVIALLVILRGGLVPSGRLRHLRRCIGAAWEEGRSEDDRATGSECRRPIS